jgi:hypothetical protein
MKKIEAALVVVLLSSLGMAQSKKVAPAKSSGPAGQTVVSGPPPGAEKVSDLVWRYKDGDKVWIYTKTPFGFSKAEEGATPAARPAAAPAALRIVSMEGDTVRFERPTPFGVSRWTKKIADLDPEEKELVEKTKPKQESAAAAGKE